MSSDWAAYRDAGVDYDVLDAAKRRSIEQAAATLGYARDRGASVVAESVGEPATLIDLGGIRLAVVLECLGTKSMIARAVESDLGLDRWHAVGIDTVAAVVNDLCCLGALPLAVNAYLATGDSGWYSGGRHASLVAGWRHACEQAGAAWVGGESPALAGMVAPGQVDLAGSAVGRVPDGAEAWLGSRLSAGDEIVLVASSGLHANGASLARKVAASSPSGWAESLPSGRALGDAVLDPSVIYVGLVSALVESGLPVHYSTHVTGHGWRKLMRAQRELTYRLQDVPEVPEVLAALSDLAGLSPNEAYATFNMGAGFALFVADGAGESAAAVAAENGYEAIVAGRVEDGPRCVVIEPLGIIYASGQLELR